MSAAEPPVAPPPALQKVKALLFDVFGTVVDWRSTIHAELIQRARNKIESPGFQGFPQELQARLKGLTDDDWAKFAQEWRNSYGTFTKTFVPGVTEWKDIDTHHYESVVELMNRWHVAEAFTSDEMKSLSLIWHYLDPWKDSPDGLKLLGAKFVTSSLSNGNQSLLHDLKEHGGLAFQRLISSADFKAYKPHPTTYLGAAATLGFKPEECAMVAAHLDDLKGAKSCGFRTIYVERPREEAWTQERQQLEGARVWVDLWVAEREGGFIEVATRLGISD